MGDIIKLLPDAIANQIAAGEVVQRPSSAVKELIENAIDAGSTEIKLIIKDAGKSLIQVLDNGVGMSERDARMSFERHATSKISNANDLFKLKTMGFRGEALASIAAISQVEMRTKTDQDEVGLVLNVEGGGFKKQTATQCEKGTSISVKNVFYNVPARRNFLKSNPVETRHIIDEFQRLALSHPEIAFTLYNNENQMYQLAPGKLSQRIVGLFGTNYKEQLVTCNEDTEHLNIRGYIGKPEFAKKTRGEQFIFVNNRYIRSNYLNHAILGGYEGLINKDSFPFYSLFIDIDPSHIDVNVHPTKTEIKFEDERTIYGVIKAVIRQALGTHNVTPSLDFDMNVNVDLKTAIERVGQSEMGKTSNYTNFKNAPSKPSNLANWEKLYDVSKKEEGISELSNIDEIEQTSMTFESAVNTGDSVSNHIGEQTPSIKPFSIHNKYLLVQVKAGLMIIDQQYAHERVLYEKYLKDVDQQSGASQKVLFPQQVALGQSDFVLLESIENEVKAIGFDYDIFGKNTISINGVPTEVLGENPKTVFEDLLEQFKSNKESLEVNDKENIARAFAKRSSIKSGIKLSKEECESIVEQLFACQNPNYTPDGNKTLYVLKNEELANLFL